MGEGCKQARPGWPGRCRCRCKCEVDGGRLGIER